MMLAIDASRAAEAQKTGVGWYCHHLLSHLKDVIPDDVGVVLYSDQPLPEELHPWPGNWDERVLKRHGPMWSQLVLANAVLRDQPDVLFVPAHVIPFTLACAPRSRRSKLVTTIHDIVFKQFPESYSARERWYADHATRLAVRSADRIIVPTETVRRDLERYYRCDAEKIAVIHHGVLPPPSSRGDRDEGSHITVQSPPCDRHDNGVRSLPLRSVGASGGQVAHARDDEGGVVLYVGRLERKKNVARIVEAFSRVAPQHPGLQFVLAGPPGHGHEEVRLAIEQSPVRDRIVTPGWVDRSEYDRLLSEAVVFLFPTLGEGFGLPTLEAMAAGVPVITSRGGAHEEVAGDAALLVDPFDTHAIADALERLLRDQRLRDDLVHRGQQRAAEFTWDRSAQQTWDVLSI